MAVDALERLDRRLAVDHGGDDLAVLGDGLATDDDPVAVADRRVDHRVAADLEQEQLAVPDELAGEREHVLDHLLGEDRAAGGDPADDGHVGRRRHAARRSAWSGKLDAAPSGAAQVPTPRESSGVHDLDGARAVGVAAQVALALERRELVLDARRAGEPDGLADLAHARRVAARLDRRPDRVEHEPLARRQAVRARRGVRAARGPSPGPLGLGRVPWSVTALLLRRGGRLVGPLRLAPPASSRRSRAPDLRRRDAPGGRVSGSWCAVLHRQPRDVGTEDQTSVRPCLDSVGRMLVDIVQTFDEQAFERSAGTPGRPGRAGNERRDERDGDGTRDAERRDVEHAASAPPQRARTPPRVAAGGRAPCAGACSGAPAAHRARPRSCSGSSPPLVVARRDAARQPRRRRRARAARRRSCGTSCSRARRCGRSPSASPARREDVRDVVVDLVRLNELPDAGLMAGQVDRACPAGLTRAHAASATG